MHSRSFIAECRPETSLQRLRFLCWPCQMSYKQSGSDHCFQFAVTRDHFFNLGPELSHHWGFRFLHPCTCPNISILCGLNVQEGGPRALTCVVVINVCGNCTKWWPIYCSGSAHYRLSILKLWHQAQARACWTVIKRHSVKKETPILGKRVTVAILVW